MRHTVIKLQAKSFQTTQSAPSDFIDSRTSILYIALRYLNIQKKAKGLSSKN